MVAALNAERVRFGRPRVVADGALGLAAQAKSERNAATGVLSHARDTGECIARGQTSVGQVVSDWMGDPPHRAIILHDAYARVGVGFAVARDGTPFWTACFAS
jgi:uncharacterized protein YkwD